MIIKGFNIIKGFVSIVGEVIEAIVLVCHTTFNGSDENTTADSIISDISTDTTGTYSFWFRTQDNTPTGYQRLFSISNTSNVTYLDLIFQATTGKLQTAASNAGSTRFNAQSTTSAILTNDTWHNIQLVQDGVAPKIYLDAANVPLTYSTSTEKGFWVNGGTFNATTIGALRYNNTTLQYSDGDFDEVFYSSTALSAAQVLSVYNQGRNNPDYSTVPGIVSHWKMDTLNPVDEIQSYWTTYNGSDEYTSIVNHTSIDFDRLDAFSIHLVVDFDDTADSILFSKREGSGNYRGYEVRRLVSGKLRFSFTSVINTSDIVIDTSTTTLGTGLVYVLITVDGTGNASGVNFYYDGVIQGKDAAITDNLTTTTLTTNTLYISGRNGTVVPFDGKYHEVAMFATELSSGDAVTLKNLGKNEPDYSSVGSGAVMHLHMDSLNPLDVSVNSNNGTSVNQDSSNIEDDINNATSVNQDASNIICE